MSGRDTRLLVIGPNGVQVMDPDNPARALALDLSATPNADARAPLMVVIQQLCSMGHWHQVGPQLELPHYDEVTP